MTIEDLLKRSNLTKYKLSKSSGIPYTTLSDICSGKTKLEKCSVETIYKLSKELGVTMEEIIQPYFDTRCSFELFKSNVCHSLKALGDVKFLIEVLERDDITKYYDLKWFPECLYLLAMLDYISNSNEVPLCTKYSEMRTCKLDEVIYPVGVHLKSLVLVDETVLENAIENAIPEFLQFNIVENDIRNVI